jgi:hypothetical protein
VLRFSTISRASSVDWLKGPKSGLPGKGGSSVSSRITVVKKLHMKTLVVEA